MVGFSKIQKEMDIFFALKNFLAEEKENEVYQHQLFRDSFNFSAKLRENMSDVPDSRDFKVLYQNESDRVAYAAKKLAIFKKAYDEINSKQQVAKLLPGESILFSKKNILNSLFDMVKNFERKYSGKTSYDFYNLLANDDSSKGKMITQLSLPLYLKHMAERWEKVLTEEVEKSLNKEKGKSQEDHLLKLLLGAEEDKETEEKE